MRPAGTAAHGCGNRFARFARIEPATCRTRNGPPEAVMRTYALAALLSFIAGFVDTAGFLGLQGLFTAHVTGNFVTLGAALVLGTHGVVAKLLALPEFVLVVALVRLAGAVLAARRWPAVRLLLTAHVV